VEVTLYSVFSSHPAQAAHLMLEHKGIRHAVIDLVPGSHAAVVRALGFRSGTVPALMLGKRRVQGTRAIARALEEVKPEPPLFPTDPGERLRVEEAERWGDEILQPVPRRLFAWLTVRRRDARVLIAGAAGLPAPGALGSANWLVAWYFARKVHATDTESVARMVAGLPALLDHVDELLREGTIGGPQRNAADFQIATTVRLLMSYADLFPLLDGRRAASFAAEMLPAYPFGVPAGFVPRAWLVAGFLAPGVITST